MLSLIKKKTTKNNLHVSGSPAKQKKNRVHNYYLVLSSVYEGLIFELTNTSIEILRFIQNAFILKLIKCLVYNHI